MFHRRRPTIPGKECCPWNHFGEMLPASGDGQWATSAISTTTISTAISKDVNLFPVIP